MDSNVNNYLLYIDISETETPDYEQICINSVDFNANETLDTWFDLCYDKANNVRVALDLAWSITFKLDKTDPVAQFILGKEFSTGTDSTANVRIVNLLKGSSGKQIDFVATFSDINYTVETPTVLEINFTLKVYQNSSFAETDYVVPSV